MPKVDLGRGLQGIGSFSDCIVITAKSETAFTAKFCLKSGTRGHLILGIPEL
jgi:hypothetical protein